MTHEERARKWLELHPVGHEAQVVSLAAELAAVAEEAVAFSVAVNEAGNIEDEFSAAIHEAFPTRSGSHDEYAAAMKMVGNRFDKGALVALVNWLLVRLKEKKS